MQVTDLDAPNAVHMKNISLVSKGNKKEYEEVNKWHQCGKEPLDNDNGSCVEENFNNSWLWFKSIVYSTHQCYQ